MAKFVRARYLALLCTGLLFLLGGLAFYVEAQVFKMNAVVTGGKITRLIEDRDSKGNLRYIPVFVFADQNGVQHEITSSRSSSPAIGDVGSYLQVMYHPNNPSDARIVDFISTKIAAVFSGLGVILLVFGIIILRRFSTPENRLGSF